MKAAVKRDAPEAANDWDRRGLPAWTYHSPAALRLEIEQVFLTHWQLAGHVSDIPASGDYFTLDIADERALILRDDKGVVRAFHNLCRHRGSRIVGDRKGHCRNALVCPFHGWVYNFDGTLRGAARPQSFGAMDKSRFGLKPLDIDLWNGFIFIRFQPGPQPPLSRLMARFAPEVEHYRMAEVVPTKGFYEFATPVNWKSVRDVDNEGYHVAMAHPALQDLYGATYVDEPYRDSINRATGTYSSHGGRRWSVRHYLKHAPEQTWLPEDLRRRWTYFGLFPNCVIAVTPELVQFYQEFPLAVSNTLQRGAVYRRPEESRAQKLARYLAQRIDRETGREDVQLTIWSDESMKSKAFDDFHLSDLEMGVRSHHDHLRRALPVLGLAREPKDGTIADLNRSLVAAGI
ncbi:MAG: aromatic ring-hydroxylating dioxygenase subunit alpha [Alphaproteobacteria bacterium]|nr:aromatic ring-hydroxylating dioxygenase subunit alpha [Alphaproteobacteria bacterium]